VSTPSHINTLDRRLQVQCSHDNESPSHRPAFKMMIFEYAMLQAIGFLACKKQVMEVMGVDILPRSS
jgi:hypothetical protein